ARAPPPHPHPSYASSASEQAALSSPIKGEGAGSWLERSLRRHRLVRRGMVAFGDRAVAHHGPTGETLAVLGGLLRRPPSQPSREIAGVERIARAAGIERVE